MRLAVIVLLAPALWGQMPEIGNARTEIRAVSGPLEGEIRRLGAGPYWAGYAEPMIPGRHGNMCLSGSGQHAAGAPVRLEGQTTMVVLVRVENGQVDQLRVTSPDCRLDGGGLPFYWLTGVTPEASVSFLRTQVTDGHANLAVFPIALQAGPAADKALEDLTSAGQPERVRERVAFWTGSTRGAWGVAVLRRMLADDPSQKVREQVIFALSLSEDPGGMAALIEAARNDKSPAVRGRALFWLARKAAGKQALDTIQAGVNDPERSVKEQAVFALHQLPEGQAVPLLIEVAKNNPDAAVRKKAMFWLGQSKDERALEFFAQVLRP